MLLLQQSNQRGLRSDEQTQIWYISIWASLTSASITESGSGVQPAQCVSYCSCHRAASHHSHCHPHFRFHSDLSEITPHRPLYMPPHAQPASGSGPGSWFLRNSSNLRSAGPRYLYSSYIASQSTPMVLMVFGVCFFLCWSGFFWKLDVQYLNSLSGLAVCVCLLLVRAKAKIKGNKELATLGL